MNEFTTDSPQHNVTVNTQPWPSVSEFVLQVRLGVTVFCILALPCLTLGVVSKEVNLYSGLVWFWLFILVINGSM